MKNTNKLRGHRNGPVLDLGDRRGADFWPGRLSLLLGRRRAAVEHFDVGFGAVLGRHDAEVAAAGAGAAAARARHLVDAVGARVDRAGQALALRLVVARNLDPERRLHVIEGARRLQVHRVPPDLDERVLVIVHVGTRHVRSPVALRAGRTPPLAPVRHAHAGGIYVEVRRGGGPVVCSGHGQRLLRAGPDQRRDQHGFVAGQHGLAKRHVSAAGGVLRHHGPLPVVAVVVAAVWLLQVPTGIAVQPAVLALRVGVRGGRGVPLAH